MTILKCGLFPRMPQPELEAFAGERMEWVKAVEGAQSYKGMSFKSEKV